ncbi:MAG: STAS/SEC14 domain-containing protein [Bacteroidia bacterium]
METFNPPPYAKELSVFWTWMGTDGIARTKTKPLAVVTIKEAIENSIAVTELYKDKKFPLLVDARNIRSMEKEARKHFSTNGRATKINSMAIMVRSPLSRVIGNFFMGLNKPEMPARLFDDESYAVEWLKKYI